MISVRYSGRAQLGTSHLGGCIQLQSYVSLDWIIDFVLFENIPNDFLCVCNGVGILFFVWIFFNFIDLVRYPTCRPDLIYIAR